MKSDGEDVSLPNGDRVPIHFRQHLHPIPEVLHPGGSDEDSIKGRALEQQLCLEGRQLATERIAAHLDVEHTEVVSVQHDHSGAGPKHGLPRTGELDQRRGQALSLNSQPDGRGFAPRDDEPIHSLEITGCADFSSGDLKAFKCLRVSLEPALKGEDADHQPRFWSSPPLS